MFVNPNVIHKNIMGFLAVFEGKPRRWSRLYVETMRVIKKEEEKRKEETEKNEKGR